MFAEFLLPLLIVACASGGLAHDRLDWQPLLDQQDVVIRQMMDTLTQTRSVRAGPVPIDFCFDWYKSDQFGITKLYNDDMKDCLDASDYAKKLLSALSFKERTDIVSRGHSVCSELTICENATDTLDFFICFNSASSSNLQNLYGISADSERGVNNMTIEYQRITDDERLCTSTCRNAYVTSLSTSATNLNNCLMGQWSPPEVTGASTTEAPKQATEAAPETTEAAPQVTEAAPETTKAPETTEAAPAETTEAAPQTTEAAPAETTKAPETTEAAPAETTEAAPEITEAAPQTTEAAPVETTEAAVPQTTVVEPTESETTQSEDEGADEFLPEEDLYRFRPMSRMNMWNIMRRL